MYLVFGPSASLHEKCMYVVFGLSAMWRTCLYLVLGHLQTSVQRMCVYPMFGPSANFHAKNMRACTWYLGHPYTILCIPDVWGICQLPREEYACVHQIFRPSVRYHVKIYAHICHEECMYMHAIWCLGHLPTSMWRICMDAFMYSADFCEEYACVCVRQLLTSCV